MINKKKEEIKNAIHDWGDYNPFALFYKLINWKQIDWADSCQFREPVHSEIKSDKTIKTADKS